MQMIRRTWMVLGLVAGFGGTAWGATKTVVLDVPGMTCATCPITVKKALNKVPGVEKVDVSYPKKQAVVTFDDAKTDAPTLARATTNAGYPSTVEAGKK